MSLENWTRCSHSKLVRDRRWLTFVVTSQDKRALELMKKVTYYSMDEQGLRRMLTEENAIDWSTYFLIGGEFRALQRVLYYSVMTGLHNTV